MSKKWPSEDKFKDLLQKAAKRPTKGTLDSAVEIALEDEKQYYKHAAAIMDRSLRHASAECRVNILYVVSAVLRRANSGSGSKSKLLTRMEPLLPKLFAALSEAPEDHKPRASKVLASWAREGVCREPLLSELEAAISPAEGLPDKQQQPPPPPQSPPSAAPSLREEAAHAGSNGGDAAAAAVIAGLVNSRQAGDGGGEREPDQQQQPPRVPEGTAGTAAASPAEVGHRAKGQPREREAPGDPAELPPPPPPPLPPPPPPMPFGASSMTTEAVARAAQAQAASCPRPLGSAAQELPARPLPSGEAPHQPACTPSGPAEAGAGARKRRRPSKWDAGPETWRWAQAPPARSPPPPPTEPEPSSPPGPLQPWSRSAAHRDAPSTGEEMYDPFEDDEVTPTLPPPPPGPPPAFARFLKPMSDSPTELSPGSAQ
uniref:CID domain-containing protein n=1 Tax=Tetraselmis sp. GSL018 TaxID=582737 RepID=A0A061SC69_9CHLO|mmetsp:Transcript_9080/g.21863  ORF Transcript_9080/g.21863 Transcript_9080/m.21863 type:complete len:429 (-) Transcript_9080:101-1387(-)